MGWLSQGALRNWAIRPGLPPEDPRVGEGMTAGWFSGSVSLPPSLPSLQGSTSWSPIFLPVHHSGPWVKGGTNEVCPDGPPKVRWASLPPLDMGTRRPRPRQGTYSLGLGGASGSAPTASRELNLLRVWGVPADQGCWAPYGFHGLHGLCPSKATFKESQQVGTRSGERDWALSGRLQLLRGRVGCF